MSASSADLPVWESAVALANTRLDFTGLNALDSAVQKLFGGQPPKGLQTKPVRLAILSSCTTAHLHPAIRTAGLRRNVHIEIYESDFGQYLQELLDAESELHKFKPNFVLFCLDAHHLTAGFTSGMDNEMARAEIDQVFGRIRECWRLAREAFGCQIIQQTVLNPFPALMGENEHRLAGSCADAADRLNLLLREATADPEVALLAVDRKAARNGLLAWFNPALWHRSKQEIAPAAAPVYGDLVGRIIAAHQGRSAKCLVLDLDNTLWGGVIGDDGLEGIRLGQGSAEGEAFVAVQDYARELARRGIILAVNSKNDEKNAVEAFDKHPDMVLKKGDIACFVANWQDKATNMRNIAAQLNIGIDALVFLDDNPVERALIRQELPMVAVPEVPEDPALWPLMLADAGYFESLAITAEDRERSAQYQGNLQRDQLKASSTDIKSFLTGLEMQLVWGRFDRLNFQRIVQLINKTNQFNLTTKRYTDADVEAVMKDERSVGIQMRLLDRFGDNGIIGILIGRLNGDGDMMLDIWLMSCRVLGRQVEEATLNVIAGVAQSMGAKKLVGLYKPSAKNGMVAEHYRKLGFDVEPAKEDGSTHSSLDLGQFTPKDTFISIKEAGNDL